MSALQSSCLPSLHRRLLHIISAQSCLHSSIHSALTPDHVKHLIDNYKGDDLLTGIYVQPSQRIFSDSQFTKAGAIVKEDLSDVDLLLGVKRVADEEDLIPDKTYMFFSHVIKGQPENMELLKVCHST